MKKRTKEIKKMVENELLGLSKVMDVSKEFNMYKSGSASYYRDQLVNIRAVAVDYGGYNINSAKQMRELVEELCIMARDALQHKKLYVQIGVK